MVRGGRPGAAQRRSRAFRTDRRAPGEARDQHQRSSAVGHGRVGIRRNHRYPFRQWFSFARRSRYSAERPLSKMIIICRKEAAAMSAHCQVTGRKPGFGKSVSHSHKRTSRRWNPNIQRKTYYLPSEDRRITLNVSAKGIKTIDRDGIEAVVARLRARGEKI
ncbi:50S ribosomal protein L28 [Nocardia arthritidis]|uniref:Large ribosomal subunit protein bL28 n=2 Tax=Nocardia arthritidis TaxID=228602 RepID=A0A6G9YRQ3_9NOCA|nr:50S ribosomal protein L28 [Nocardia arthritidis]